MELFQLLGTIAIDNTKANKTIDDTTGKAQKSESKMSSAFKKIGLAVAAAFTVDKIKDFGLGCLEAAANVKAMNSQFEQTFGTLQNEAASAIDRVANASNILDTRLQGVGTSIYAFAKTTGMESTEALGMMERALQVTADSAAYYDRSLEETSESLKSFLKGNFENDAALGLSCTETTRNAKANELYGQSFKDLSEAQKQLTLLAMVEDANKLSGAMGQAAREGEGWENVLGNLKESMKQFMAVVGTPILSLAVPVVQKLTDGFVFMKSALEGMMGGDFFNGKFEGVASTVLPAVQSAWGVFCSALQTFWETIGKPVFETASNMIVFLAQMFADKIPIMQSLWLSLKPVFEQIGQLLQNVVLPAFEIVFQAAWTIVGQCFNAIASLWANVLLPVFNAIVSTINFVSDGVASGFNFIQDTISAATSAIKEKVTSGFTAMRDAIQEKIESAKEIVKSGIEKLKSFFDFEWKLPDIKLPHFSVTGEFSLNPPSIPSFGVEWYKKGAVLTQPTIFGMNPFSGKAMVGGEAGAEAIAPIDTLKTYIKEAVLGAVEAQRETQEAAQNYYNFTFNSPKEISPAEANKQAKRAYRDLQLGY